MDEIENPFEQNIPGALKAAWDRAAKKPEVAEIIKRMDACARDARSSRGMKRADIQAKFREGVHPEEEKLRAALIDAGVDPEKASQLVLGKVASITPTRSINTAYADTAAISEALKADPQRPVLTPDNPQDALRLLQELSETHKPIAVAAQKLIDAYERFSEMRAKSGIVQPEMPAQSGEQETSHQPSAARVSFRDSIAEGAGTPPALRKNKRSSGQHKMPPEELAVSNGKGALRQRLWAIGKVSDIDGRLIVIAFANMLEEHFHIESPPSKAL